MDDIKNNSDDTKKKIIHDKQMRKIAKNLDKSLKNYRQNLKYLGGDAPISLLCLPDNLVKVLANNGIYRIYDLFDRDLTEIEGIGPIRLRDLTTRLDQFLAMG